MRSFTMLTTSCVALALLATTTSAVKCYTFNACTELDMTLGRNVTVGVNVTECKNENSCSVEGKPTRIDDEKCAVCKLECINCWSPNSMDQLYDKCKGGAGDGFAYCCDATRGRDYADVVATVMRIFKADDARGPRGHGLGAFFVNITGDEHQLQK